MQNDSNVTLNGVYYAPNGNDPEEVLNLDKIKAKKRLGLPLTAAEEQTLAAAQAKTILFGKAEE